MPLFFLIIANINIPETLHKPTCITCEFLKLNEKNKKLRYVNENVFLIEHTQSMQIALVEQMLKCIWFL